MVRKYYSWQSWANEKWKERYCMQPQLEEQSKDHKSKDQKTKDILQRESEDIFLED